MAAACARGLATHSWATRPPLRMPPPPWRPPAAARAASRPTGRQAPPCPLAAAPSCHLPRRSDRRTVARRGEARRGEARRPPAAAAARRRHTTGEQGRIRRVSKAAAASSAAASAAAAAAAASAAAAALGAPYLGGDIGGTLDVPGGVGDAHEEHVDGGEQPDVVRRGVLRACEQRGRASGAGSRGRQTGVSELLQWSSSSSSEEARGPVAEPR